MEINELRELLSIINSENEPVGIRVHLVKKNEDDSESTLLADVSQELSDDLKKIFKDTINRKFFENEELNFSNISTALETINSAFFYDIDEFPDKLSVLQDFDTWEDYDEFSFSNDDLESIKAILITVGNQGRYFTIFKHIYAVTIVRQDKMLGFVPIGNRFEKLNSNILQINNSIDFIYAADSLIVNNIKTLSAAYGYKEIVKNQAREKIQMIGDLDLIENLDELTQFVENVKYAKRVLRINPESPVMQLAKTRIIEFVSGHTKLSRKIRFNGNGDKIVLDTDVSKVITIGILNDDYLKSNLTDLDYESEKKAEIDIEDD
ncbi:MAG: DUF4868 domain-containing protein [Cyclobacteriaceae bacterium]|nr:DUF4868 domain-containing protein [Cyclobacteriaceae bacterium]